MELQPGIAWHSQTVFLTRGSQESTPDVAISFGRPFRGGGSPVLPEYSRIFGEALTNRPDNYWQFYSS